MAHDLLLEAPFVVQCLTCSLCTCARTEVCGPCTPHLAPGCLPSPDTHTCVHSLPAGASSPFLGLHLPPRLAKSAVPALPLWLPLTQACAMVRFCSIRPVFLLPVFHSSTRPSSRPLGRLHTHCCAPPCGSPGRHQGMPSPVCVAILPSCKWLRLAHELYVLTFARLTLSQDECCQHVPLSYLPQPLRAHPPPPLLCL